MSKSIKEIKEIFADLSNGYTEKTRDSGAKYYVYEGKFETEDRDARFNVDSGLASLDLVAEIAHDSVKFLYLYLTEVEDETESIDDLDADEELRDEVDRLTIYTKDNNDIICKYGLDYALELYTSEFGSLEKISAAELAYNIRYTMMREYLANLLEELS